MLFKEPISQIVRKILDAPFAKKRCVFWLLIPILFLIAIIVACIGKYRRYKGYATFDSLPVAAIPKNLQVICIGNLLIGGTGKSPIVRTCATEYLKKNFIVAIAARGIDTSCRVTINSAHFIQNDLNKLSDENREHFELLKNQFPDKHFFIFQNPNRKEALCDYIGIISQIKNQEAIFILDDGLQHFLCPRHINICISDKQLNEIAPAYPWPIGPYREGFGYTSIQKIMASFDVRIWKTHSTDNKSIFAFPSDWRQAKKFHDLSVTYTLQFVKFTIFENKTFVFHSTEQNEIKTHANKNLLMIAGIAHPENFFSDLEEITQNWETYNTCILPDHGPITPTCLEQIKQSDVIILTLKDFFRFCTNETFLSLCQTRIVYGCHPDYTLLCVL